LFSGYTSGCACKKRTAALVIAVASALGAAVLAFHYYKTGGHHPVSVRAADKMVSKMTHGAAHVTKTFPGPDGLTGIVIKGSQGPLIAWVTDQKSAIIVGNVVDQGNHNVTTLATHMYLEKSGLSGLAVGSGPAAAGTPSSVHPSSQHTEYVSNSQAPDASSGKSGEAMLRSFVNDPHQAVTIQDPNTNGPHPLYVFFDPNCIFCHKLFDLVRGNVAMFNKAGVRVVYVPVAILKQSSANKAAEIVAGGWPVLLKDETGFNENTEEGGLSGNGVSSQALAAAHLDTEVMSRLASGNHLAVETPMLVWKAGNQHVYYLNGAPGSSAGLGKLLASFSSGWKPEGK
jgi:thiol:disulfide interchange protein DsbG